MQAHQQVRIRRLRLNPREKEKQFMGRSPCCEKEHTNKGAWTKEEDQRLTAYIKKHGEGSWRSLPKAASLLRCGKSCRLRWINYLRPDLKRGNFSDEDDQLIIKLHSLLGNKWSLIAARLPGRTDNEIKNYWNTHIRRKLLSKGINPVNHRPLHEPQGNTTTIHFKGEDKVVEFDSSSSSNSTEELFMRRQSEEGERRWRCPDLNLDLCISSPFQQQQHVFDHDEDVKREGFITLCFSCKLGVEKSSECKCGGGGGDFLGLRRVLHYRSLESN